MLRRWLGTAAIALGLAVAALAQPRPGFNAAAEIAAVKRVIAARRDYQIALEQLRHQIHMMFSRELFQVPPRHRGRR